VEVTLRRPCSRVPGTRVLDSREICAARVTSRRRRRTITLMTAVPATSAPSSTVRERAGAWRVVVACALASTALSLLALTVTLTLLDDGSVWWLAASSAVVFPAVLGVLIALYRPANMIGWLLLGDAVNVAAGFVATPYAHYGLVTDPGSLPGARWALLWSSTGWPALLAFPVALVLAFPNGRLPTSRWRAVAVAGVVSFAALQASALFEPQHYTEPYAQVTSPLPSLPGAVGVALLPFWFGAFAILFVAAWAVRVRFRSATGIERLQLLWLTYGASLIPLTLLACLADILVGSRAGVVTAIVLVVGLTVIPAAVGVAVFRYRLFDIELIFSRTLVYAVLTACVVAGYLALFFAIDRLIDVRGVAGVVAAGLVAMGFQPLREVLQQRVHRLVYGERSDPYGALVRLGQRLQSAPDPGEVFTTIVDGVAGALRLGYCALALRRDEVPEVAAERGVRAREPQCVVPLSYQGEEIGELVAEPAPGSVLSSTDRQLLEDLARQAGVAVHSVRVMSELQRSRERLIAAREEERLRLRRDLHDGLGPTLAALVFKIGVIRDNLRGDPDRSERLLLELGAETKDAIADIRRLVYALRPPALDELGLIGAVREHAALLAETAGLEISVESPDLPQLPPAVEVAAYRIVTEALTNAARHAEASCCHIELRLRDGLEIEVCDDGTGLAANARPGVGLRSMRERADELGGSFAAGRATNGGTRIRARLPVEP
jgi:two-component system, NarL family, sensor kinase